MSLQRRLWQIQHWILLDGNRLAVSTVLAFGVFLATVIFGSVTPWLVGQPVITGSSAGTALYYLLTGIITLVTIILSINQLVLSYQIGPIEKQHDALESLLQHRRDARDLSDTPDLSQKPSTFLSTLLTGIDNHASTTKNAVQNASLSSELQDQLLNAVDNIQDKTRSLHDPLKTVQFKDIEFVQVIGHMDAANDINALRNLKAQPEAFPSPVEDTVNTLLQNLELFLVAGEYFKIGHLQSEFIEFSRSLLYIGLPALVLTFYATQLFNAATVSGTTLGISNVIWLASFAFAVGVSPLIFLISYMSRLVTLSQTTIFSGPFKRGAEESPLYWSDNTANNA